MEIEYEFKNNYITKKDNIYRRNGLLIAKVIKLYQCVDCEHISNTIEETDNHYKKFHQNCISNSAYHKNYGKSKNFINNENLQQNRFDIYEQKSFEEINFGKRLKTYSRKPIEDNHLFIDQSDQEFVEEMVESSDQRFKDRERMEYKCELCDISFASKSKLSLHENFHLFPKICDYPYCEEKFAMDYELQTHYRNCHESHDIKQLFKCDLCEKVYSNEAETRLHRKIHTDPKVCDFPNCGKSFSCNSILKKHYQTHDRSQKYVCDDCGKEFPLQVRLSMHRKLHTNPIVCDFDGCEKVFSSNCFLKSHRSVHFDAKPYSCEWPGCDFVSKHPQSVTMHLKTHSDERPHLCHWPHCGIGFKSASALRRHIACKHKKERKFVCDWPECEKSFCYKETLINHKRVHTGERPFICQYENCNRSFSNKDSLNRHELSHGVNPYICDFTGCSLSFNTISSYISHKKVYHVSELEGNNNNIDTNESE